MNVVIVKWTVSVGSEDAFLDKWKQLNFKDSSGLFREFLSKVGENELSTWKLNPESHSVFVNVGIWESAEAFERQVGKFMAQKHPFEAQVRERVVLDQVLLDRGGKYELPPPRIVNPDEKV